MSVAIRRAIYGKMAGDTTLTNLLASPPTGWSKSIYYEYAPEDATFPYVLFSKSSGVPSYAMKQNAYDDEIWAVKGVAKRGQGGTISEADSVDGIASRLDALLTDGTLSISGRTLLYLRRESDITYAEVTDGVLYRHAGADFRLVSE